MSVWLFAGGVLSGLVVSYSLRGRFSGRRFSLWKFWFLLVFNLFFVTYYMRIMERSYYLFVGYYPEYIYENPAAAWLCLAGMWLHSFALPVPWEPKRWFRKIR